MLCIRAAYFVPLPGFSLANKRSIITNVVDLLVPTDLTGALPAVVLRTSPLLQR